MELEAALRNHMEVHWMEYTADDADIPITEASLIEKSAIIGRCGLELLSCGTGAWRVRSSMNTLSRELGVTCTVDIGLMSLTYNCFDGEECVSQSLCLTNTGVNTSKLNRLEQFVADFPTKGIIMGRAGIRAAYATGRGKIVLRARTEFEDFGKDRVRIIVTELPYQVNKRMLIKSMADQVNEKKLEGISDIRDETDRTGMRIVIELKRDANPQVVLNRLFTQTQLQTSFAINMLALVNNQKQPKILSLRHILDEYLAYQEQVITRRTQYDLKKAREREHLLQGLLIAQDNIDEVIHIIRTSYDDAKEKLMARFDLSDIQAQAILEMRLKALQGLDREKLQNEYDELEKKIAYFVELLSNETMLKGVLKDELIEIRDKYGDERKTEIQDVEDEIDIEDLIEEEQASFEVLFDEGEAQLLEYRICG